MLKKEGKGLHEEQNISCAFGRSISMLHRFSQRFLDNELKPYHINKSQMEILFILFQAGKGVNQTEINDFFGYNKATITKLINRLEKEGYVERRASRHDKREKIIMLTVKGQEIYPVIREAAEKEAKILEEMLDENDSVFVREVLFNMSEATKRYNI